MEGMHVGDAREFAHRLPAQSVQTIITSPPYWGLRSYLADDDPAKALEMGSEATPEDFVANLVAVFAALRPALRDDGTLWLNLGDSYVANRGNSPKKPGHDNKAVHSTLAIRQNRIPGKEKDLIGIPWRVAFALQADGWILRSDIIWHKPNPMPESVRDRPTRAHEYLFLLTKQARYFYDALAIAEDATADNRELFRGADKYTGGNAFNNSAEKQATGRGHVANLTGTRNKRSVWSIPTSPFPGSHFATFPPELVRPCIRAGTSAYGACAACGAPWRRVVERTPMVIARSGRSEAMGEYGRTNTSGTMLEPPTSTTTGWEPSCQCGTAETVPCLVCDPFLGSGTTAMVAIEEGRRWVGCDLDARNAALVAGRIDGRQVRMAVGR